LQKSDGDFVLTRINEPSGPVGTVGGAAGTVEREQLRSAAGAYRVSGQGDLNLDSLVGKEVRIVGTIEADMDLPRANADREPVEVKTADLAHIDASSVSTLADACRSGESPAGARQ
jgi:hypothetical protein